MHLSLSLYICIYIYMYIYIYVDNNDTNHTDDNDNTNHNENNNNNDNDNNCDFSGHSGVANASGREGSLAGPNWFPGSGRGSRGKAREAELPACLPASTSALTARCPV